MGTMIPLGDASRRPLHRPVITASIILMYREEYVTRTA